MTNFVDLVGHQHADLESLARSISRAVAADNMDRSDVERLISLLSVHDALERAYVFPVVASRLDAGRQHLVKLREAHGRQTRILAEIDRRRPDDPYQGVLLAQAAGEVRRHVDEEQAVLSVLNEHLAKEEADKIGAAMTAAQRRAPTRPHPHLAGSGGGTRFANRMLGPLDRLRDRVQHRPLAPSPAAAATRRKRHDILALLEDDHASARRMLAELTDYPASASLDDTARKHLIDYVVAELSRHDGAEALVVWPAVRRRLPSGDDLADKALAQERHIRFILDALQVAHDDEARRQLSSEARAAVATHLLLEEGQVWPELRRATTRVGRSVMGLKYAVSTRMAPTRPHPRGPDRPRGLETRGVASAVADRLRDRATGRG